MAAKKKKKVVEDSITVSFEGDVWITSITKGKVDKTRLDDDVVVLLLAKMIEEALKEELKKVKP